MTQEQLLKKQVKVEYKQNQNKLSFEQLEKECSEVKKQLSNRILTGILPSEHILENDYPVHFDYLYVAEYDDGEFRVIRSDIKGSVLKLKQNMKANWIYSCDLIKRNLL